ncbi:MAG: thioredoxin family protein, partial [Gaiellaceae bacterium]
TEGASPRLVVVALAFALGSALVLFARAFGGRRIADAVRRAGRGPTLQRVLGVVMLATALAMATDTDLRFQSTLADHLPSWAVTPTQGLENDDAVQRRLADLHDGPKFAASHPQMAGEALPDLGAAPDFTGNERWFNTAGGRPLSLRQLRGKVVLVDFWTYTCINCLRTLPYMKSWDRKYGKDGLVIVGVHTPEFAFEHVVSNVREASRKLGVRYPVAIDNDYRTWDAYQNDAWPAEYLIDRRGHVREVKKGEGHYDETERSIRALLGESGTAQLATVKDRTPQHLTTPESYLGWTRLERYVGSPITPDREAAYRFPREIPLNDLAYAGDWSIERERIVAGRGARLRLHFLAQNVYLVLSGRGRLRVLVGGRPVKTVRVDGLSRLYTLLRYPDLSEGALELRLTPGIAAYAFTFG